MHAVRDTVKEVVEGVEPQVRRERFEAQKWVVGASLNEALLRTYNSKQSVQKRKNPPLGWVRLLTICLL
jgi:hypothetical protein